MNILCTPHFSSEFDSAFGYESNMPNIASNEDCFYLPDVQIREITRIDEKKKWMRAFIKHYSGETIPLNSAMFGEGVRFLVGSIKGKDVGFLRITDKTKFFAQHYKGKVWNASDAYVKAIYRGQSVLRQLLNFAISHYEVKMVRLETSRLIENLGYYESLGFTYSCGVEDGYLAIAVTDEIKDSFIKVTKRN